MIFPPRFFKGLVRWSEGAGGAEETVSKISRRFEFGAGEHFQSVEVYGTAAGSQTFVFCEK